MSQHRPTLVPAIFALLSLAISCAISARAIHAAPCIAKPNAPAPQGEHWYYRTDRAIGRQCWFLGPEDANNQRDVTQAPDRPASDSVAPQPAQRPTVATPPAATETNFRTPTNPPLSPDATKLPYMPPVFLTPPPAPAEQQQSGDAIDPPPAAPASDPASEPQARAIEQSSPVPAPLQSTGDADHTLALAMIVFLTTAIFGSVLGVMRWRRRRKSSDRSVPEWAPSSTLYQRTQASPAVNSPARDIPPPPSSFGDAERLAQDLQKILDELRTRPSDSLYEPSGLTRSG